MRNEGRRWWRWAPPWRWCSPPVAAVSKGGGSTAASVQCSPPVAAAVERRQQRRGNKPTRPRASRELDHDRGRRRQDQCDPASPRHSPNSAPRRASSGPTARVASTAARSTTWARRTTSSTPRQDLPTVKKIVEQDKAFAIVPMVSPVLAAGGTYLVNNKVPFFGWGITPGLLQQRCGLRLHRLPGADGPEGQVSTASAGLVEKLLGIKDGTGKTVALISED